MADGTCDASRFDPLLLAVLSQRMQSIVREMQNTLLRGGRSANVNTARDFSCAILTANHELVAAGDGLPVHIFGAHLLTQAVERNHSAIRVGDAFLHNDPYSGGTHAADHTIIVPVFVGDMLTFYAVAKAHQADCGNSAPTTYMPTAHDVYAEGALVFPAVRVQREKHDVEDIVRMCRARIRAPEQWYGDYLAMLGAARIGELRLLEFCDEYGLDTVQSFLEAWFAYAEDAMARKIRNLPALRFSGAGRHDPIPGLDEGIPVAAEIEIDPEAALVTVDLRDNVDCVPAGVNESEACALANALTGVFNSIAIGHAIPANAGSFRRVRVVLRENCVVGIPRFPHSCSVATTNVGARLVVTIQHAFAEALPGHGLAEGSCGLGPSSGVISGTDPAREDAQYVNQQAFAAQGGPAGPVCDGWLTYGTSVTNGLMNRDSVEVIEQKYPLLVREVRVRADSEGAGEFRGAPGTIVAFGSARGVMTVNWSMDGRANPPRGARGGGDGARSVALKEYADGRCEELPGVGSVALAPGEVIVHLPSGGGGYGNPLERSAEAVRADVLGGLVTIERARDTYGVVLVSTANGAVVVDLAATAALRQQLAMPPLSR